MVGDISYIIVIQSLPVNDPQTGIELYKDVICRQIEYLNLGNKIHKNYFDVDSKNDLFHILSHIKDISPHIPGGLVIHFETHGSGDKKGLVLKDRSLIVWKELVNRLRQINIELRNNLYVTMATCHGRDLYIGVDLLQKSPYSGYLSANGEISIADVRDDFQTLFKKVVECGNLINGYLQTTKERKIETGNYSPFYYKDLKTTFEETITKTRWQKDNDPNYRKFLIDQYITAGYNPSNKELNYLIEESFNKLVEQQKATFDF